MPHGTERRFDGIGGADTAPRFGGKVVERHQRVPILRQTLHRSGKLGLVSGLEVIEGAIRQVAGFRLPDLVQGVLGVVLGALRQPIQHIARLVHPASLMTGLRPQFRHRRPESQCAIADRQFRSVHAV